MLGFGWVEGVTALCCEGGVWGVVFVFVFVLRARSLLCYVVSFFLIFCPD